MVVSRKKNETTKPSPKFNNSIFSQLFNKFIVTRLPLSDSVILAASKDGYNSLYGRKLLDTANGSLG
ncbi:MAG: hypothetical protein RLZZ292_3891 [Bacteroidota bacterium]|jgi:hypothetical protein